MLSLTHISESPPYKTQTHSRQPGKCNPTYETMLFESLLLCSTTQNARLPGKVQHVNELDAERRQRWSQKMRCADEHWLPVCKLFLLKQTDNTALIFQHDFFGNITLGCMSLHLQKSFINGGCTELGFACLLQNTPGFNAGYQTATHFRQHGPKSVHRSNYKTKSCQIHNLVRLLYD